MFRAMASPPHWESLVGLCEIVLKSVSCFSLAVYISVFSQSLILLSGSLVAGHYYNVKTRSGELQFVRFLSPVSKRWTRSEAGCCTVAVLFLTAASLLENLSIINKLLWSTIRFCDLVSFTLTIILNLKRTSTCTIKP